MGGRKRGFFILGIVLLLSLSFVSAGFSGLYKMTGDVVNADDIVGWTQWFDIDDSSGSGDYELLENYDIGFNVCSNPISVECQTTTGLDYSQTGETVYADLSKGCWCVNSLQDDSVCNYDYKVRFNCGEEVEETWCTDSDGGLNYYVRGSAYNSRGNELLDECIVTNTAGEVNTLREAVCFDYTTSSADLNHVKFEDYICPNGCVDGACVEVAEESYCDGSRCLVYEDDVVYMNEYSFELLDLDVDNYYENRIDVQFKFYGESYEFSSWDIGDSEDFHYYEDGKAIEAELTLLDFDDNKNFISFEYEITGAGDCIDSDRGLNIYIAGSAEIEGVGGSSDYCDYYDDKNILYEAVCNDDGSYGKVRMECSGDTPYCLRGACTNEEPVLVDSDGGDNPGVKGSIWSIKSFESYESADYCFDENDPWNFEECSGETCELREYYPIGIINTFRDYSCVDGCVDGACVEFENCGEGVISVIEKQKSESCDDVLYISFVDSDKAAFTLNGVVTETLGEGGIFFSDVYEYEIKDILYSSNDEVPSKVELSFKRITPMQSCSDVSGVICSEEEYCDGGWNFETSDIFWGEKCCVGGSCVPKFEENCELGERCTLKPFGQVVIDGFVFLAVTGEKWDYEGAPRVEWVSFYVDSVKVGKSQLIENEETSFETVSGSVISIFVDDIDYELDDSGEVVFIVEREGGGVSYCNQNVDDVLSCLLYEGDKAIIDDNPDYYHSIDYIDDDEVKLNLEWEGLEISIPKLREGDYYNVKELNDYNPDSEVMYNIHILDILYSSEESDVFMVKFEVLLNSLVDGSCDNGCLVGDTCVPVCYRKDGMYCGLGKNMNDQFDSGEECDNSCECESNACVNGQCISGGLIQKIIDWLGGFFG